MTKEKDATLLAEAYSTIKSNKYIRESGDPNDIQNAIMIALGVLSGPALNAAYEYIQKLKNDQGPIDNSSSGTKLDASGNPANPSELTGPLPQSLQIDRNQLNKGKTKV